MHLHRHPPPDTGPRVVTGLDVYISTGAVLRTLLAGGGSGVVPLLSMLRHRAAKAPAVPALLIYSVRDAGEIIAAEGYTPVPVD